MGLLSRLCTDYVSEIDALFHSPAPTSAAREQEVAVAKRIARLRDTAPPVQMSPKAKHIWEAF